MSMPAIERVIPLVGHLPAAIRDALARRLREVAGLCLIALSGVAAAALMTWSVQDPSLSHATSRAIRNIVGYPGAIGADLLMQIFGLGAVMLILPIAVLLRAQTGPAEKTIIFAAWLMPGVLMFAALPVQVGPLVSLALLAAILWHVAKPATLAAER